MQLCFGLAKDGKELEQKTPIKMAVEPGSHNVSLRQAGEVMWRQHFVAEARTQYEFNPSMSDVKRREREEREAQAARVQLQLLAVGRVRRITNFEPGTPLMLDVDEVKYCDAR